MVQALDQIQGVDNTQNWLAATRAGITDRQLQQNYAIQNQNRLMRQNVGNALAGESDDMPQSQKLALQGGDFDLYGQLHGWAQKAADDELATVQKQHELTANLLANIKTPQQLEMALGVAQNMKSISPDEAAQIRDNAQRFGLDATMQHYAGLVGKQNDVIQAAQAQRQQAYKEIGQVAAQYQGDPDAWMNEAVPRLRAAGYNVDDVAAPGGLQIAIGRAGLGGQVMTNEAKADAKGSKELPIYKVPEDATGEAVLSALPPSAAALVKKYANYDLPLPGGFALSKPYWQNMMQIISQYDPSFDAKDYATKQATRKDFTSGKASQNITSFNTAIAHASELDSAIDDLRNSDYPVWNRLANSYARNTGDTRFQTADKKFATARTALTDELTRAFRLSGGNVHDIKAWEDNLGTADSPQALHSAVQEAMKLLRGRIDALGDQYNRGMSTTKEPLDLLSPKAKAAFQKLSGEGSEDIGTSINANPPKSIAVGPNGHKIGWFGGDQWIDLDTGKPVER